MRIDRMNPPVGGTQTAPTARKEATPAQPAPAADVFQSTQKTTKAVDYEAYLRDCLKELGSFSASVSVVPDGLSEDRLYQLAQAAGPGAHLLVSESFLRRMGESPEAYRRGMDMMKGLLGQLTETGANGAGVGALLDGDSLTFWASQTQPDPLQALEDEARGFESLLEQMRKALEQAKNQKNQFRITISKGSDSAEVMGRLARATTESGVRQAVAMARRSICSLKLAASLGTEAERPKLRAAIRRLEQVASRGPQKIRALRNENDLRLREKKATQEQERRRAEQLKLERKRRKTLRQLREHGQVAEELRMRYPLQEQYERKLREFEAFSGGSESAAAATGTETVAAAPVQTEVFVSPTVVITAAV